MTLHSPFTRPSLGGALGGALALISPLYRLATHTPHTPLGECTRPGGGVHAKNRAEFCARFHLVPMPRMAGGVLVRGGECSLRSSEKNSGGADGAGV